MLFQLVCARVAGAASSRKPYAELSTAERAAYRADGIRRDQLQRDGRAEEHATYGKPEDSEDEEQAPSSRRAPKPSVRVKRMSEQRSTSTNLTQPRKGTKEAKTLANIAALDLRAAKRQKLGGFLFPVAS